MTAGPVNQTTASRGGLRASHADRERVTEVLKTAFVQGRLTKDEFEERLGQAFASRTYAELAAVTVDIPADLVRDLPARARGRPPMSNAAKTAISVAIAAATLAVSFFTDTYAFAMFAFFYLMALVVAAVQILSSRRDSRSRHCAGQKLPGRRNGPALSRARQDLLPERAWFLPTPACSARGRERRLEH